MCLHDGTALASHTEDALTCLPVIASLLAIATESCDAAIESSSTAAELSEYVPVLRQKGVLKHLPYQDSISTEPDLCDALQTSNPLQGPSPHARAGMLHSLLHVQ